MLSVCALAELSANPLQMNSAAVGLSPQQVNADFGKSSSVFIKKRVSRRFPVKNARHASRDLIKHRKTKRKGTAQMAGGPQLACSIGDRKLPAAEVNLSREARPLVVPRIDIVQASPTIGSRSPEVNLARSPSMPAVLPESTPAYTQYTHPIRPTLTRPLTTPSVQSGETAPCLSPDWERMASGSIDHLPLLPLPGTPAVELPDHNLKTEDNAVPLHTCGTDTTQSMPVTFSFPQSNTSRASSFPSGCHNGTRAPASTRQASSNGSKHSSSSGSLSSSISRLTNQVRVLRVTNPDPPSPLRSAAPSRTPSMTIAQKRFVSCPPAPLLVERANEYKATGTKFSSTFDSPLSQSTGTPISGSNSASTPSFRFSDGGRSPITPASVLSSLPATPTKASVEPVQQVGFQEGYKLYDTAKTVYSTLNKGLESRILAPPVERSVVSFTPTTNITAPQHERSGKTTKKKKKGVKVRHLKRCKSTSSGDGDNSEGVESCFESIGTSSECEHVTVRKKRARAKAKASKTKQKTVKPLASDILTTQTREVQEEKPATSRKAIERKEAVKEELPKSPRSPLLLDKPRVKAISDTPSEANMENLSTFWTPMGRVIIAPVASTCSSGLKLPGTPASPVIPLDSSAQEKKEESECSPSRQQYDRSSNLHQTQDGTKPPRAFLVPPRSPRPPNTRRLGHARDPLSRSELCPPRYEKKESLLSVPQTSAYNTDGKNGSGVANISLSLSLPLPSPMRLHAFTSELLARCSGVNIHSINTENASVFPAGFNTGRRSSVDEILEDKVKKRSHGKEVEELNQRKALPSPGDPFVLPPPDNTSACQISADLPSSSKRPVPFPAQFGARCGSSQPFSNQPKLLFPEVQKEAEGVEDGTRCSEKVQNGTHQISSPNNHLVKRPYYLPPPLPPRPGERRDATPSVAGLREQLVVNGALVSGDEDDEAARYRRIRQHRPYTQGISDENEHHYTSKKEHRRHNHKKATLYTQDKEEDLMIPIKRTYPDGVALMEYERARSLHTAIVQSDAYQVYEPGHHEKKRVQSRAALPVPTPSAYLEQKLERSACAPVDVGRGVYAEDQMKQRSGFEALQRRDDVHGRYGRECGHERTRGRDRHRQEYYDDLRRRGVGIQYSNQEAMLEREAQRAEEGEDVEEGAIRLGEHKRGFDSGEIERWLEGLRRAAVHQDKGNSKETSMMVDVC